MIVGLLVLPVAFAAPVDPPLTALVTHPVEAAARVALAEALPTDREDETLAILAAESTGAGVTASHARGLLATRLAARPTRSAWEPLYAVALAGPPLPETPRLRVRLAEVRAHHPATRKAGLAELTTLARAGADPALGDALLGLGHVDAAAAVYTRARDADGAAWVALARGDRAALVEARRRLPATGGASGMAVDAALLDFGRVGCARALVTAGWTSAALGLLSGAHTAEEARLVATALEAQRDDAGAVHAWEEAVALDPTDAPTRRSSALALEAAGDPARARKVLGDADPALATRLGAAAAVVAAAATKTSADDGPAAEAAYAVAPADPIVARAWGAARLEAGDAAGALRPLAGALEASPADRGLVGLHAKAALAAGAPETAIDVTRRALALAPDPATRAGLLDDVVALEVVLGEREKGSGDSDAAMGHYASALAIHPDAPDVLMGAAGLYWQARRLEGAWALYRRALALDPGNVDALLGAVSVGLGADHEDEAKALLAAAPPNDPRVAALRASAERAERSRSARDAMRAGDLVNAVEAFQALIHTWPADGELFHGLADALTSLRRDEDALLAWREALRLDPTDAWAAVGAANALVSLGRPGEARACLDADFPAEPPPGAALERRRVEARAWRADGDAARARGDLHGALEAYAQALAAAPDEWVSIALAGLYLQAGQPAAALAYYDEALAEAPEEEVALRGRALALEATGRPAAGLAVLDALVARSPTPENLAARADLAPRVALAEAMADRARGDEVAAAARITDALASGTPTADLLAASAGVALAQGRVAAAVDAARQALTTDGGNAWARAMVLAAGRAGGCTASLLSLFEQATAEHPGEAAERDLAEARLDAAVQEAAERGRAGRTADAIAALRHAETLAVGPDPWVRIGGGWLGLARPADAEVAFARALAVAPDSVDARLGQAGVLVAEGRLSAAEVQLTHDLDHLGDPRFALALARVQQQRGLYPAAARTLDRIGAGGGAAPDGAPGAARDGAPGAAAEADGAPGSDGAPVVTGASADAAPGSDATPVVTGASADAAPVVTGADAAPVVTGASADAAPADDAPLRVIPPPSGRAVPTIVPPAPLPPTPVDLTVPTAEVRGEVHKQLAPRASLGAGAITRGGGVGKVGLTALVAPIDVGPAPIGLVRLGIEVVPLHLVDETGTDDGVAASLGVATPAGRRLGFTARLGSSPIGFDGGVYPTWNAHLAVRLGPIVNTGVETGRAPRSDSRLSWAGEVFPTTGQLFGRVSELWIGSWLAVSPGRWSVGALGRAGYVEGIGVEPNPKGEGVVWAGRSFGDATHALRVGADAVAQGYERREDGFVPGEGGYFSPPFFGIAQLRLDGSLGTGPLRVCAGVGAGPRYQGGAATPFDEPGFGGAGAAHAGLGVRFGPRWDLTVDVQAQASTSGWHQVGGLARLTWGVPATLPGAPAFTTLAAHGLALPADDESCSVP